MRNLAILNLKNRLKESLKYRFFHGYCQILKILKILLSSNIKWKVLDSSYPLFVSIVYEADVPLLAHSLKSMMERVERRPSFWLIGDSDSAYYKLKSWLGSSIPSDVELWHWEDLLKKLDPRYQSIIKVWINSGRWGGYAKRFAITLAANAERDILMFDADILWFGDFPSSLKSLIVNNHTIFAGKDYGRAYDSEVATFLGEARIFAEEPLNCGIVYYPRGVLAPIITPEKLISLRPYAERATTHLEQTIIAYAFWQSGGEWFDTATVATTMVDNFKYKRPVQSLARHYAGAKHLFWRDA